MNIIVISHEYPPIGGGGANACLNLSKEYIEKGNNTKLGEVNLFTFEPHISIEGSKYGYKKEDIYYFENGVLKKL